jgi:hypothetical protein
MATKTSILLAAGIVIAVGWASIAHPQTAKPAATWEYREMQLSESASSIPLMNKLGAEGWELVSVVSACNPNYAGTNQARCEWWAYFKRRT